MSLRDTAFQYYSGSSVDLAKAGYNGSRNRTSPSTSLSSNTVTSIAMVATERRSSGSSSSYRLDSTGSSSTAGSGSGVSRQHSGRVTSRRTATTEFGVSSSGASALRWTNDLYTVGDIIERFQTDLPLIVKVNRGYSGHEDGHDSCQLIVGQVLQVYGNCEQVRINATDKTDRELSLPYDLQIIVRPKTASGFGHPRRLSQAVEDGLRLPLAVRVIDITAASASASASNIQRTDGRNEPLRERIADQLIGSDLTVTALCRCQLLLANVILDGWLSPQLHVIPAELTPNVTIATGLIGATPDEWTDYRGMFARAARQQRQDHVTGYAGIYYIQWAGQQPAPFNDKRRLNVSPYIIANGEVDQRSRDGEDRTNQRRLVASSSALTNSRPLPPYRPPPRSASAATPSGTGSFESLSNAAASAAVTGRTERQVLLSGHRGGSVDLPHASTSSKSNSPPSTKSLSGSTLDVNSVTIETSCFNEDVAVYPLRRPSIDGMTSPSDGNLGHPSIVIVDEVGGCVKLLQSSTSVTTASSLSANSSAAAPIKSLFSPSNCPQMGKRPSLAVLLMKNSLSSSGDQQVVSTTRSANAIPVTRDPAVEAASIAAFGGSLPCLQLPNERPSTSPSQHHQQLAESQVLRRDGVNLRQRQQPQNKAQNSRVRFSVDYSSPSTTSTNSCVIDNLSENTSLKTSGSSLFDEEGYYTKDSSTSGSSLSGTSSSNGMSSSRQQLFIEPAFL